MAMNKASMTLTCIAVAVMTLFLAQCSQPGNTNQNSVQNQGPMINITKTIFGHIDGQEVYLFQLENPGKMIIRLTNYGGIVTSVIVPDRNGKMDDVESY